ncbi:MAG: InlB B-repeat-containing protein [Clostridia bacterium]|nr:InlB B-repeat-containing protein [Clostridia bacterium]
MKKNFKKSLAVFMAVLMLLSVVSVSAFAATYTIKFDGGSFGVGEDPDPIVVNAKIDITVPGAAYTREGYVQKGWSTVKAGTRKHADLGGTYKVTGNKTLYPYWEVLEYTVTFAPGADGVGDTQTETVDYGKTVYFPVDAFTREGYIQVGWSTVDGGEKEYNLTGRTPKIENDTTFYPVWEKCDYTVEASLSKINFGDVCVDYDTPELEMLTLTNAGNMPLEFTLPTSEAYNVSVSSGELILDAGESVVIGIQPKGALGAGDYSETLKIDCVYDVSDVVVDVRFVVNEHSFDKYISDNNATYKEDGTKTAECSNGCGCVDTIIDLGSMKVYSANNNTVDGLLDEYLYHKTIRVTVYGSGTDDIQADGTIAEGTKRFLPISWYVNDEFNGEFTEGNYDINFVHTTFGKYTLKVSYVEQEYVDGEWVNTENTDEKSFDYYVGPSEKEEQEVVRPNMIVNIIFGIFAKLAELLGGLFG